MLPTWEACLSLEPRHHGPRPDIDEVLSITVYVIALEFDKVLWGKEKMLTETMS